MQKIFKTAGIVFALFLFSFVCQGCGKYKSLPTAGMENVFGSNPEKAGQIFDVDFSKLEPEERLMGNLEYQIFTPEENSLLGDGDGFEEGREMDVICEWTSLGVDAAYGFIKM